MLGPGTLEFNKFCTDHGWTYIDYPWNDTIWCQGSSEPNLEFLNKLKIQNTRPIVNMSIEHWGGKNSKCIESTYFLLQQHFTEFVVLTHNPADHNTLTDLFFYPYWYHITKNYFTIKTACDRSQQYQLSCINGNPRFHRIANFIKLLDKPYAGKIFKTMGDADAYTYTVRPDDFSLPKDTIEQWQKICPVINANGTPKFVENIWNHHADNTHLAFEDSYVNLVTETTILPEVFITEKSWKAIASGQLFLLLGNAFSIKHLKDLGVDVFDDIIDHSHYDNETDWETRLINLHEVVDQLMDMNLDSLWKQTYIRRLANQQKFYRGDFDKIYIDCLLNRLLQ